MNSSNWEDSDNWNTQEPSTKEKPNHSFLNKKRSDEQFSKKEHKKEHLEEDETPESCEIFVRNLSFTVDEETLKEVFSKIGRVKFTKILKNEDGSSKGLGFVNFFNLEDAKNAICESENIKIDGRYVKVSFAKGKGNSNQNSFRKGNFDKKSHNFDKKAMDDSPSYRKFSNKVFVSNLSFKLSENEIKSFFEKHGSVSDIKMLMDDRSKFKGMCVINFAEPESVEKALKCNGEEIYGRGIKVSLENSRGSTDTFRKGSDNSFRGGSRGGNRGGYRGGRRGGNEHGRRRDY